MRNQAGVVSVPLDETRMQAAVEGGLSLFDANGKQVLLAENHGAMWIRADDFVFRMSPTSSAGTARTRIFATRLGQPAPATEVAVQLVPGGTGLRDGLLPAFPRRR